jgi:alpha(1,3/1,4) fucosyltransferase
VKKSGRLTKNLPVMKQVLIRPLWDMGLNGKLFETIYPYTMKLWRKAAARLGIVLDAWDTMPLDRADCIWLLDLPDRKATLDDARRRARPGVPFVLHVMESPVGRAHNFVPANQALCDYVVTYQQNTAGNAGQFSYRLPHSLTFNGVHVPFEQKRCAILVNTNRVEGYLAVRQAGLIGLPGIGRSLSGWKMPPWFWFMPGRGELYSWRRKMARTAEETNPDLLDVFGPGWSGERISWCPLFSRRPYKCCKGGHTSKKLELVAGYRFCISVENYRGTYDYISEKIFDPLVAGTVPVYLGDEHITKLVPEKAIVDVRNFRNHRELLNYLRSCSKTEWEEIHQTGQNFLKTEAARSFSTERFVRQMNRILLKVLGLPPAPESELGIIESSAVGV